jgi:hypothetical protein
MAVNNIDVLKLFILLDKLSHLYSNRERHQMRHSIASRVEEKRPLSIPWKMRDKIQHVFSGSYTLFIVCGKTIKIVNT